MRVRLLKDLITGERYFKEVATGMVFRRIVGSLVWPCGERQGCLVVLGETRSRQNAMGISRHDVHRLEEMRGDDVSVLLSQMARMTEDWMVRYWATPMADPRVYLLDDMNDNQRRLRRPLFHYGDPQGWQGRGEGLLPFYHALVQRRTRSEKTLFLGDACTGADEIAKLQVEDMTQKPTDFPGAAALCFALAEIDIDPWPEWGERVKLCGGPADELGGY